MARPKTFKESVPALWRMTRHFWPDVRKHRALIVVSLVALSGEIALRLLEPWPLKFVFDRFIPSSSSNARPFAFDVSKIDTTSLLLWAAGALVIITALRAFASYRSTIGFAQIGNRVLTRVRSRLYRHIQYLSLSFHTRARTGDLVVRVINDVSMLQDVAVTALLPTIAKVLLVAGMLGLMFWMNWRLALVAISILPLFYLRTVTLSRRIREVAQKQREQQGAMAATAAESITAIRTVQALSLEGSFAQAFSAENERTLKEDVKGKRLAASLERSVDVLVALATALVLYYGGMLVVRGQISPGDLVVFLAYLKYAYRPVQDFAKYSGRLAKASASADRVMDLLERVPDVRDLPGAAPAPALKGAVRFEGVDFSYEHEKPLLRGIDLTVEAGQHVALVGPSGGGKSTLMSLVLRLYDPTRGRVTIDGRDVREFTLESLRNQISVVLQDNLLFASSIRDNIGCGAPHAARDDIETAARLANAHHFITALPEGYDTVIGERGVTLSHGQRQRIAIARAAIRRAPILILDEPATGLDKENQRHVLQALERLYSDRTTFLITHDPSHAMHADMILFLEEGRILECGTPAELIQAGGRYAAMHNLRRNGGTEKQLHARAG
ncbi:MAG: ABC transporter ATP-binding protein/permease [Verrucomicrobia subdivision 3 bacterium]|nr:ABC transporter ATP-binding protein/permease [Limisphaerales bacterium]